MVQAEWIWVPGSVLRWFTHPHTITHRGTNCAWHRVTTLIESNALPLSHTSIISVLYNCLSLVTTAICYHYHVICHFCAVLSLPTVSQDFILFNHCILWPCGDVCCCTVLPLFWMLSLFIFTFVVVRCYARARHMPSCSLCYVREFCQNE